MQNFHDLRRIIHNQLHWHSHNVTALSKTFQLTTEKHLLASSAPLSIDKRQHCKDAKSIFTNDLIVIKLDLYIMLRDH